MQSASERTVIVTGVGFRCPDGWQGDPYSDHVAKANIGAITALKLAERGSRVAVVGRREEVVNSISAALNRRFPGAVAAAEAMDLTDEVNAQHFVRSLPRGTGIDLVQCVGLSSGHYKLRDDNPYALISDLTPDTVIAEMRVPVLALINCVRSLLPIWETEHPSRVVVVNSMSGIRAYRRGSSHATSKGALHQAIRSLCLELYSKSVFVCEINPGIVDTGLYDREVVRLAVQDIAASFGQTISPSSLPSMAPGAVADAVLLALTSPSHILQVNMVALGQFPNLGA
jgi:NADP-dependent 3-hydroxy acid dehydrogenase YdfG